MLPLPVLLLPRLLHVQLLPRLFSSYLHCQAPNQRRRELMFIQSSLLPRLVDNTLENSRPSGTLYHPTLTLQSFPAQSSLLSLPENVRHFVPSWRNILRAQQLRSTTRALSFWCVSEEEEEEVRFARSFLRKGKCPG